MQHRRRVPVGGIVKLTAVILALVETFTGCVADSIVYTFSYSTDVLTGESSSSYYITASWFSNKQLYRIIIILYAPIVCLWNIRSRVICRLSGIVVSCSRSLPHDGDSCEHRCHRKQLFDLFLSSNWPSYLLPIKPLRRPFVWSLHLISSIAECIWPLPHAFKNRICCVSNQNLAGNIQHHVSVNVHIRQQRQQVAHKQYNTVYALFRKLPWKFVSRCYGKLHRIELPLCLRPYFLRVYIWTFGCSLEDAAISDLCHYRNLSEFFLRSLRPGIRPVDQSCYLTSPVDGRVVHCGTVGSEGLEQVKGVTYSLSGFLGPLGGPVVHATTQNVSFTDITNLGDDTVYSKWLTSDTNHLYQCVVYLSPADYHHFHSPADWIVTGRRYFPGELFTVSPGIVRWCQGVFNFNERVAYFGKWPFGFFSMTAVGATLVGSINVYFDKDLSTNSTGSKDYYYDADFTSGVRLHKGQPMGDFRLGSTIILLFEAPPGFQFSVESGQKVKYGCGISVSGPPT